MQMILTVGSGSGFFSRVESGSATLIYMLYNYTLIDQLCNIMILNEKTVVLIKSGISLSLKKTSSGFV